jgi:hypothetical protein
MSTWQLLREAPGSDTSSDVERVVEATRHLHAFREGYAHALEWMAEHAAENWQEKQAIQFLEPMLRILGESRANRMAVRLYRIACDVTTDDLRIDKDIALLCMGKVAAEAAHAVADEFHRDSCICREVTSR